MTACLDCGHPAGPLCPACTHVAHTFGLTADERLAKLRGQPGLFEVDPADYVEPEVLGRGARRQRLIAGRIATGVHPLGNVLLHTDAARGRQGEGLRCGTCRWRQLARHHDRVYAKCWFGDGIRVSHGEASDIRAWWPACTDYERGV